MTSTAVKVHVAKMSPSERRDAREQIAHRARPARPEGRESAPQRETISVRRNYWKYAAIGLAVALLVTVAYQIGLSGRLDFWNATLRFDLQDSLTHGAAADVIVSVYDAYNRVAGRCITDGVGVCAVDVLRGFFHASAVSDKYAATPFDVTPQTTMYTLTVSPTTATIIQPGSMTSTASYTVFTDSTSYFIKNGTTGGVDTSASTADSLLSSLVTTLTTLKRSVVFMPGTYLASTAHTFASTTSVTLTQGALFSIATGMTITINGPFTAPLSQVFNPTGTGKVVFGKGVVDPVYPAWWGNGPNTAGIQEAINSLNNNGGDVQLTAGSYYIYSTITVPTGVNIRGVGNNGNTVVCPGGSVNPLFNVTGSYSAMSYLSIQACGFTGVTGIVVFNAAGTEMDHMRFSQGLAIGLDLMSRTGSTQTIWGYYSNVIFVGDTIGLKLDGMSGYGVNSNTFVGGYFSGTGAVTGVSICQQCDTNTFVGIDFEVPLTGMSISGFSNKCLGCRFEAETYDVNFTSSSYGNVFSTGSAAYAKVNQLSTNAMGNQFISVEGVNFQGWSLVTPGVPLSTTELQNTFPFEVLVYVNGTGSGITAYSIRDQTNTKKTITTTVGVGFLAPLLPGEKISLSYTGSPTWLWYGT